jgi:putative endonuclease
MPFVYIVRCADNTFYTGWAVDVTLRVKRHNAGRGAKYTRARLPVKLVYSEELATRLEAMRRERAIKRYPRAKKLALVKSQKLINRGARRERRDLKSSQRTLRTPR